MYFKYFILVFLVVFSIEGLSAQSIKRLKSEAEEYFNHQKYEGALERYLTVQKKKTGDLEARLNIGICYFHLNQLSEAEKYLQFVIENAKDVDEKAYLYLAKTYHYQLRFKDAIQSYKSYLRNVKDSDAYRDYVKDEIIRCASGLKLEHNERLAIVENMGNKINTSYDDFAPVLSPNYDDKIYFTSSRPGNLGGLRNAKGLKDDKFGNYNADMYSSLVINGEWTGTAPMSSLINSPRHDMVLGFNDSGTILYYFKGPSLFSGKILVDTFRADGNRSIFPDSFESPMACHQGDGAPQFYNDSTLIFTSRRKGGYGGQDLYITRFKNNQWTPAENLGPMINSAYDETTPFLAADGRTLYFSSNNLSSMGGLDVFKSVYDDVSEEWSSPENLGVPINSAGDDAYYKLSPSGLKGFFSSSRKDAFGKRDVYVAYYKRIQKEQKANPFPHLFADVPDYKRKLAMNNVPMETPNSGSGTVTSVPPTNQYIEEDIVEYEIAPIYYNNDDQVLTTANKLELNKIARLMLEYPQLKLMLTSNSDGSVPQKFDLYFSAKRAEEVAQYLVDNGVKRSSIIVKGCGANYQVALNTLESGPNPTGQRLNRRIDIDILNTIGLPLRIVDKSLLVPDYMRNENGNYYKRSIQGLSYKVQVAAINQMYNGDLITIYPDPMVETSLDDKTYRYTVGLYQTFSSADQLRKELERKGVTDAFVVPYIHGLRVDRDGSKIYSAAYPDLMDFIESLDKE